MALYGDSSMWNGTTTSSMCGCGLFDLHDVYLMVFIAIVPGNLFELGDNSTYRIRVMRSFNIRKSKGNKSPRGHDAPPSIAVSTLDAISQYI